MSFSYVLLYLTRFDEEIDFFRKLKISSGLEFLERFFKLFVW